MTFLNCYFTTFCQLKGKAKATGKFGKNFSVFIKSHGFHVSFLRVTLCCNVLLIAVIPLPSQVL